MNCTKWFQFGLHLGLYGSTLKAIETDYRGKTVDCFHECMSAWLRGEDNVREEGGPSWSSLATALDGIEEKSIATIIRDKYCHSSLLEGHIKVRINLSQLTHKNSLIHTNNQEVI